MTTVGIIQPNFIPWRGYFDFIREVDVFVFLDDVQYTSQDWRNRNRLRSRSGPSQWITVPVLGSRSALLRDVRIDPNPRWARKHLAYLRQNYARAPHLDLVTGLLAEAYDRHGSLSDLNIALCRRIMALLGLETPTLRASELGCEGVKDARLIALVQRLNGDRYLSGPAAKAYLQPGLWADAGIELAFKGYGGYPEYRQIAEPFDPAVSIIDLLAMEGSRARHYLGTSS